MHKPNTGNPAGTPSITGFSVPPADGGEFARFKRLTSSLIKVPKSDLAEGTKKKS